MATEQRARARELALHMGFKTDISDSHAARMVEVLSPFIPGLAIVNPSTTEDLPDWLGAKWVKPKSGRKNEWSPEVLADLLGRVTRLKQDGRWSTDDLALAEIIKHSPPPFDRGWPALESLRPRLSEARRNARGDKAD